LKRTAQRELNRLIVLTILLWAAPLCAFVDMDAQSGERLYAIPVIEAQAVITPWLKNNGFRLSHPAGEFPGLQIEANKPGVHWSIRLHTHSPLATRIQVQTAQGQSDPRLVPFWQHLDDYVLLQRPGSVSAVIPQAVLDLLDAIVCIYADREGSPLQLSGFGIDRRGIIVSTAHDLQVGQTLDVHFRDGSTTTGRVTALDARRDLCLIRVPGPLQTIIPIQDGQFMPDRQDMLFVLGCPPAGQDGIHCATLDGPRRVAGLPLWQVRTTIAPGSSGSPVLDTRGRLAAVVKGRYRGSNAVGFLIPFETLLQFLWNHSI
jgi:serine protease Do